MKNKLVTEVGPPPKKKKKKSSCRVLLTYHLKKIDRNFCLICRLPVLLLLSIFHRLVLLLWIGNRLGDISKQNIQVKHFLKIYKTDRKRLQLTNKHQWNSLTLFSPTLLWPFLNNEGGGDSTISRVGDFFFEIKKGRLKTCVDNSFGPPEPPHKSRVLWGGATLN